MTGLTRQNLPSLRVLDLHNNKLATTKNISIPTLRQLYLASNRIPAIEGLDEVPQLTVLHLRENEIEKLDGFTGELESLQYLNLRYCNKLLHYMDVQLYMTTFSFYFHAGVTKLLNCLRLIS